MKDKLKSFFLNHGEKLGFGLIVLMALVVLSKTRWSPYSRNPQELISEAEEAETTIANSRWPEERKQELIPTKDIAERANDLRGGVDPGPYVFSTPVYTPIYPRSEPILPPTFLPPEDLIADASWVLIELPPETDDALAEESDDEAEKAEEEDDNSAVPAELRSREPRAAAGGEFAFDDCGTGFPGATGGYGGGYGEGGYGSEFDCVEEFMSGECGFYGEGAESVTRNGEGYRFVAVRAVLDWAAQKREYARALHLPLSEAARAEPQIVDFTIQRQRAVSEDAPWSGEWETLDLKHSLDVVYKAIDQEADVVDVSVTNIIITEDLPRRVLGGWEKHATHPRITNFVLSPEEQRLEQVRIDRLMKAYDEIRKNQPEPLQAGGLAAYRPDIRTMQNELSSGYAESVDSYQSNFADEMRSYYTGRGNSSTPRNFGAARPGAAGGDPDLLVSARGRSPASGRLLLFRYFDFDVEPGAVYRYRVRLEYANPNFGKPIELLASPELAEGQKRSSDWSEPTPPVQVEPEAEYFLTGVEYESKVRDDVAVMDIYKLNTPTGTMVNDTGRFSVGDEIGGILDTPVVNPLDKTYEGQEIKLNTGDIVIDFRDQDDFKIDGSLPDLEKIPSGVRYDEALVMNSFGNLRTFDRFTRESERAERKRFQKFQKKLGEEYEEAATRALDSSDLLGGYGGEGGEYGGEYGAAGRRAPSSAAARRRARQRGRAPLRSSTGGEGGEYGGGGCR